MTTFRIDGYAVRLWSSRRTTNLSPGTAVAAIYLYEGNIFRGHILFFPDGTPLSPPSEHPNSRIFLNFNLCQFEATIETLRNESPIYLDYYSSTNAALRTGKEPVGEEE